MTLKTRKPTGRAPYPLVLLEGAEKAGKTYAALALSASEKVGRTFAFDLGEGSLDEYAALGRFEIVEHDGSYRDFLGQLQAAMAEPMDPDRPNVLVIDSMTALWSALVDEATAAARRSKAGQRLLANDPDAEVPVTMDKWNVAKRKWRGVMDPLMSYPGIVVLTARGKEVAAVEGGKPVEGRKEWKVEAEKSLPFDASVIVRMPEPRVAQLTGVRSLRVQVPEGKALPLPGFTLERLIFDTLGLSADNTAPRQVAHADAADTSDKAFVEAWSAEVDVAPDEDTLRGLFRVLNAKVGAGEVTETDAEALKTLLVARRETLLEQASQPAEPAAQPAAQAEQAEQSEEQESLADVAKKAKASRDKAAAKTVADADAEAAALAALEQGGLVGAGSPA